MLTTLAAAPVGMPLVMERIVGPEFAARLQRLGLYEGVSLTRLDDSVAVGPAKIRGPHGEVTLGGGMAARVVIHLDNDRRQPLLECSPGDSGHVEGITGHRGVEETLATLGIKEDDRITFLRRLPPCCTRPWWMTRPPFRSTRAWLQKSLAIRPWARPSSVLWAWARSLPCARFWGARTPARAWSFRAFVWAAG